MPKTPNQAALIREATKLSKEAIRGIIELQDNARDTGFQNGILESRAIVDSIAWKQCKTFDDKQKIIDDAYKNAPKKDESLIGRGFPIP